MNDDLDIEATLRRQLRHRADSLGADTPLGGGLAIREAVRERSATRHRRRMAAASVATVAAVGTGLVLIAREPAEQDVRMKQNQSSAAAGLAGGSATGSSTGSATGSPKGWSREETTDDPDLARLATVVPPGYVLTNRYEEALRQNDGDRAADLAVAAQVEIGGPIRFVIASLQDSTRLSPGTGGTEVTIAGRPGRVISTRGATTITWDVTDTTRALVVTMGVDDATVAAWLGSLQPDAAGQWAFAASAVGGLNVVPTDTPTEQRSRSLMWEQPADPATGSCNTSGVTFDTISGGAYEFWAEVAERARWDHDLPGSTTVQFPASGPNDAPSEVLALTFDSGTSLLATDGVTVVRTTSWNWTDGGQVAAASAPGVTIVAPDDATWAAMVPTVLEPPAACRAEKERDAGVAAAGDGARSRDGSSDDRRRSLTYRWPRSIAGPSRASPRSSRSFPW